MLKRHREALISRLKIEKVKVGEDVQDSDLVMLFIGKLNLPLDYDVITTAEKLSLKTVKKSSKVSKKKSKKAKKLGGYKKITKDFYSSKEWRELRYEVLKENNGCCELCGRSKKHGIVLHCDHIKPLSKNWGMRLSKDNIQVLCEDCNVGKSNYDSIDWR